MRCSRCGWEMRQVDSRIYNNYQDYLYNCRCGNTYLDIKPNIDKKITEKFPLMIKEQSNEKALTK